MWLLDGILTSWWRRLFGEGKTKGLLGNRTFQAALFVLFQSGLWFYKDHALSWLTIVIAVWVYAMYWSKAIGCILDCGEAWWQNHESYKRWWTPIVNWLAHKLGLHKYYGAYDTIWMTFRYTLCLLPLIYWGHHIWIAGLFSAPIYYGCKWLFKKYPKLYEFFDDSKDLAEICFGFISGVIFYLGW
jgi:hypothetical protein